MVNELGKAGFSPEVTKVRTQADYKTLESAFLKLLKVSSMSHTQLITLLEPVKADDPYTKAKRATEIKNLVEKSGIAIDVIEQLQVKLGNPVFKVNMLIEAIKNDHSNKPKSLPPQAPKTCGNTAQNLQHQRAVQEAQRRLQERRRLEMGGLL